jgi:staphylococcal nuclease domain-containing protein 1
LYAGFYGDSWYRCKFERYTDEEYEVFFVDYGNVDAVSQLRTLDPALSKIKPAASLGQLSALKSAKDYLDDALDAFGNLVYERELFARVDFFDRTAGKHHLTLQEYKDSDESINSFLLKLGLLRVANRPERRLIAFSKTLKADENVARKKHLGIWQYGDVSSDEE